jgi:hypothetical protein
MIPCRSKSSDARSMKVSDWIATYRLGGAPRGAPATSSLKGAHMGRMCMYTFIGVSVCTYV